MQIAFEHTGNVTTNGTWRATGLDADLCGEYEVSQYEDEFTYDGHMRNLTEAEDLLVNWINNFREKWLQYLRCPFTWTRLVFQEGGGFIYEIRSCEPGATFTVGGWTMLQSAYTVRYNASFGPLDDLLATHTEIEAGIRWVIDEFLGRVNTEQVPYEDDRLDIEKGAPYDLVGYAGTLQGELADAVTLVHRRYNEYTTLRGKVDHLYWTANDMHTRDIMSNDDFDLISEALYIRDDEMLTLKSQSASNV